MAVSPEELDRLLGATGHDEQVHLFDPLNDEPYAACGATIAVLHINADYDVWLKLPNQCLECREQSRGELEDGAQARMNEAMLHGQSFMMGHGDRDG